MRLNFQLHSETDQSLNLKGQKTRIHLEELNSEVWSSMKLHQYGIGIGYGQKYYVLPLLIIPHLFYSLVRQKVITTSTIYFSKGQIHFPIIKVGGLQVTITPISRKENWTMLKKNLQRIHSHKNIWQTLENIRDWFIKSFKGKSILLNRLIYRKGGIVIEELTSGVRIRPLVSGLVWIQTKTGISSTSIMKPDRLLITTQGLLTRSLIDTTTFNQRSAILQELNGSVSSPKEESTSHKPIRKSEHNITHGADLELRKLLKDLNAYLGKQCQCKGCQTLMLEGILRYSSSPLAKMLYVNLKPTVGKKKALHKRKT